MPDLLAIVSKAIFDKEARGLAAGMTWPTAAYTSGSKALAALGAGGALFLVTVRPGNLLWLVAILESPSHQGGAWRAPANQVPITDITPLIPSLAFAGGKGLVHDAKLAMSLQTPRELSGDTAAALRSAAGASEAPPAPAQGASAEPAAPAKPAARPGKPAAPARSRQAAARAGDAIAAPAKPGKSSRLAAVAAPPPPAPPAPARPAGVPPEARWDASAGLWQLGVTDSGGARQGSWRSWRADGTLRGACDFLDDDLHGINRRFHPDGSVASEGVWRHGVLYDAVFFATAGETDEPRIAEGGPEVVRAEYVSSDGASNATIHYLDKDGRERDRSGALVPPRPPGVPETARWFSDENFAPPDGTPGGWVDGAIARGSARKLAIWRWWSTAGELLRTEHYSRRGALLAITERGGGDPFDAKVAAWLADPRGGASDLARAWSPELHARLRARLADLPVPATREYIYLLGEGVPEAERLWTRPVRHWRLIIELVADWEARAPADAADVIAWYILGAGAHAAFMVRDRERLVRWWKRFIQLPWPAEFPPGTSGFGALARRLDPRTGEWRKAITAALDGSEDKAIARTLAAMRSPAAMAELEAGDLARAAEVTVGAARCELVVRDPDTGDAWLIDDDNRTHYWNGSGFAPSTVVVDARMQDDVRYVSQSDRCDERVVLWQGKHGWAVVQRYGRAVFWQSARFDGSRGQAEVDRILWLRAAHPAEAQRMMRLITGDARPIDPWFDRRVGVILRSYLDDGLSPVGVHDNQLITDDRVVETFASHADAVRAFDRLEIERLRRGATLHRLYAHSPRS